MDWITVWNKGFFYKKSMYLCRELVQQHHQYLPMQELDQLDLGEWRMVNQQQRCLRWERKRKDFIELNSNVRRLSVWSSKAVPLKVYNFHLISWSLHGILCLPRDFVTCHLLCDQWLPEVMCFVDNFRGECRIFRFTIECKFIFWLSIGDLVDLFGEKPIRVLVTKQMQ